MTLTCEMETTSGCSDHGASPEPIYKVHLVLQGKGGVGKTWVASLIAQYLMQRRKPVRCFDTDPVNASLCAISGLAATPVRLLDRDRIDVDVLDAFLDSILDAQAEIVVDNGAASFLPLGRYLVENDIPAVIADHGMRTVVHTIVTGGPAMIETAKTLAAIVEQFPADVDIVVWLNAFFGPVATEAGDPFESTPLFREIRHRIRGLVHLHALDPDTAGHTLAQMRERRMTFTEALASPDFRTVAKRRLGQIRDGIWRQLAHVL